MQLQALSNLAGEVTICLLDKGEGRMCSNGGKVEAPLRRERRWLLIGRYEISSRVEIGQHVLSLRLLNEGSDRRRC